MNIHTAYTVYNNGIQSVEPQLAEAIDRIIDAKSKAVDRYKECYEICERGMHRAHDLYKDSQEKLDKVELAEVKVRMELEVIDAYYSALLKKRVLQVEEQEKEIERLGKFIETLQVVHFKEYQGEKAENKRLLEVLELYAANENYERVANEPDICEAGYSHPTWEPSWIEFDKGETARKALAGESNAI